MRVIALSKMIWFPSSSPHSRFNVLFVYLCTVSMEILIFIIECEETGCAHPCEIMFSKEPHQIKMFTWDSFGKRVNVLPIKWLRLRIVMIQLFTKIAYVTPLRLLLPFKPRVTLCFFQIRWHQCGKWHHPIIRRRETVRRRREIKGRK